MHYFFPHTHIIEMTRHTVSKHPYVSAWLVSAAPAAVSTPAPAISELYY